MSPVYLSFIIKSITIIKDLSSREGLEESKLCSLTCNE